MRTRRNSEASSPYTTLVMSCLRMVTFVSAVVAAAAGSSSDHPQAEEEKNSEYFFACSGGEFDTAKVLLEKDPSLAHATTKNGEHCLHLVAISGGGAEIVKLVLDAGADPDVRSTWDSGLRMHPLSWNTFYGRHDVIELLLKYGANVNADFDLDGKGQRGTVLDVAEQILLGSADDDDSREDKERFVKTRNVLVKNGAVRYASLEPEL